MSYPSRLQAYGRDDVEAVGGQAANLGELVRAGQPVPPGFVITTESYQAFVDANNLAPVIAAGHERAGLEFYIVAQDTLLPPPELDLEAIFVTWSSLEGAAAVARCGGIAVLRDGGTQWTIATGDGDATTHVDLLQTVAMTVSRKRADTGPDLVDLLPTEHELPAGWELATERVTPAPCER